MCSIFSSWVSNIVLICIGPKEENKNQKSTDARLMLNTKSHDGLTEKEQSSTDKSVSDYNFVYIERNAPE
jgi:hypothetical protein